MLCPPPSKKSYLELHVSPLSLIEIERDYIKSLKQVRDCHIVLELNLHCNQSDMQLHQKCDSRQEYCLHYASKKKTC